MMVLPLMMRALAMRPTSITPAARALREVMGPVGMGAASVVYKEWRPANKMRHTTSRRNIMT
jgi:hypothetical protein